MAGSARTQVHAGCLWVCALLCVAVPLPSAAQLQSLPEALQSQGLRLAQVGAGELRWFGLTIYRASLWTPDGGFSGWDAGEPVALHIRYERSVSRLRLVDATREEWDRLGIADEERRRAWLAQVSTIWPDVAPGDSITTLVLPGGETQFYGRHGVLGTIDDPAFGPAFLAIWLDRRSSDTSLRNALLNSAAH